MSIPPFGRGFSRHRGLPIRWGCFCRAPRGGHAAPVIVLVSPHARLCPSGNDSLAREVTDRPPLGLRQEHRDNRSVWSETIFLDLSGHFGNDKETSEDLLGNHTDRTVAAGQPSWVVHTPAVELGALNPPPKVHSVTPPLAPSPTANLCPFSPPTNPPPSPPQTLEPHGLLVPI